MLDSPEKQNLFIKHITTNNDITEDQCLEFKTNDIGTEKIGKYISGLANAAALKRKSHAYVVFGIKDESKEIVGTTFNPLTKREGNVEYSFYLLQKLNIKHVFNFYLVPYDGKNIVILEIAKAEIKPVKYNNIGYVRIGSTLRNLEDFSAYESDLWAIFRSVKFESNIALENKNLDEIINLLDLNTYYELLQRPIPVNPDFLINELCSQEIIKKNSYGSLDITNLGAITLAKELDHFPNLKRKGIRLTKYQGLNKNSTGKNFDGNKGYAIGFKGLLKYIHLQLPNVENLKDIREVQTIYPSLAIRELIANAIVHQDLNLIGSNPTIEIFDDRIEITNPGKPIIEIDEFLKAISRSRNEKLGNIMRKLGICEERGTGMVKVIQSLEQMHLPAPKISLLNDHTVCTLYAYKKFEDMSEDEKLQATYTHCVLQHLSSSYMTNSSLKMRFGLEDINKNSVAISKLIRKSIDEEKVKLYDPKAAGTKNTKYIPIWA